MVLVLLLPITFVCLESLMGTSWWIMLPEKLTDYLFAAIQLLFWAPIFAVMTAACRQTIGFHLDLLDGSPLWFQYVTIITCGDFMKYWWHRSVLHGPLWRFHAIHHSGVFHPYLQSRIHPIEDGANWLLTMVPPIFLGSEALLHPLSVGFMLYGYFIHTDMKVNFGVLNYVFDTPQAHHIHHSQLSEHVDKNFGVILMMWDWIFGTLHTSFNDRVVVGVAGYPVQTTSLSPIGLGKSWLRHFLYPITSS